MKNDNKILLERGIGKLGFSAIALNGVIGAGIFALPAVAAARSGYFSPWLFLFCAVLIMTVVLCFSRASSFFDDTGGPIQYADKAFGSFAGFQSGWLTYVSRLAALAANTKLMIIYAGWFWAPLESGWVHQLTVVLIFALLAFVNIVGVRKSMLMVYVFTVLKLAPLFLLIILGISHIQPELLIQSGLPEIDSFGETVLLLLYAFVGFESASVPAGEARNPRKDIAYALPITVLTITVLYFLIQWISISALPGLAESSTPLADVAVVVMGPVGAIILTLGAVFSIGGNCSVSMMTAPRMTYAMANMGTMPAWFGKVNQRFHTPVNSILFYAVIAVLLALSGSFIWLAVVSTLARLLTYILSIAALPILERKMPSTEGQFRLYGGYLIPVLGFVLCLWLITYASQTAWLTTIFFFLVGSMLYFVTTRTKNIM
ncbi:MAG: APC family permease [Xanthomonadales bacterium]|nr:APC family permease [Xanthomonadales bacterium]